MCFFNIQNLVSKSDSKILWKSSFFARIFFSNASKKFFMSPTRMFKVSRGCVLPSSLRRKKNESHPTNRSKYFWKKLPPHNCFFGGERWQLQWIFNPIWRDVASKIDVQPNYLWWGIIIACLLFLKSSNAFMRTSLSLIAFFIENSEQGYYRFWSQKSKTFQLVPLKLRRRYLNKKARMFSRRPTQDFCELKLIIIWIWLIQSKLWSLKHAYSLQSVWLYTHDALFRMVLFNFHILHYSHQYSSLFKNGIIVFTGRKAPMLSPLRIAILARFTLLYSFSSMARRIANRRTNIPCPGFLDLEPANQWDVNFYRGSWRKISFAIQNDFS